MTFSPGTAHTGTISYLSTSVRSKKWYGEGLRSHEYGKTQAVCSRTGPEIGRYRKVNQKLERYDTVPFCSRVNRKQVQFRYCTLFIEGTALEIFTKRYQQKSLLCPKSMTKKSLPCIQLLQKKFVSHMLKKFLYLSGKVL